MKKKTRDKRKRVQKYLSHDHRKSHQWRNSFGSKMEAFPCFDVIARYEYRSPISEFKIVQSEDFPTRSWSHHFQAYLAGYAVSSLNDVWPYRRKIHKPLSSVCSFFVGGDLSKMKNQSFGSTKFSTVSKKLAFGSFTAGLVCAKASFSQVKN